MTAITETSEKMCTVVYCVLICIRYSLPTGCIKSLYLYIFVIKINNWLLIDQFMSEI